MINIDTAGTLRLHVPDCNNFHIDRTCHGQRSYSGMHLANATTLAKTERESEVQRQQVIKDKRLGQLTI